MRIRFFALITAITSAIAASPVRSENIDLLMSQVFAGAEVTYIGYESVERQDIPEAATVDRKYLIVDFRFRNEQPKTEQLQASVHKACMALLRNRELIRSLSDSGYDMVSVAFDRRSQFDCL